MTYAPVNGLQLYYEIRGSGRPLVLPRGGLMTIDLNFGPLLEPLAASRQVIAVEFQGHGHTADTGRPMTIEALAGDVVALVDHLGSPRPISSASASAVSSGTRSRSARPTGSAS
jgi:pimeloyl-ACP methyl ester carboxylesterase